MAVIIYQVIRLAVRTRASSVFKGIALLLVLAWVAEVMQLNTLRWMLQLIINTGVIVLVVLFQPELRRALEQIGRSRIRGNSLFVNKQVTEARHEISEIVTALTDLSLSELKAFHPAFEQDVYDAMSLKACVEGRSIPGGPAPAAVQASIDEAREQLKAASIA